MIGFFPQIPQRIWGLVLRRCTASDRVESVHSNHHESSSTHDRRTMALQSLLDESTLYQLCSSRVTGQTAQCNTKSFDEKNDIADALTTLTVCFPSSV